MAKNRGMSEAREDQLFLALDGIYNELEQNINAAKDAIVKEVKAASMQGASAASAPAHYDATLLAKMNEQISVCKSLAMEVKYALQQNQAVHSDMTEFIKDEFNGRFGDAESTTALAKQMQDSFAEVQTKIAAINFDEAVDTIISAMPAPVDAEALDTDKISETISGAIKAAVAEQIQQVLDAIAAIPVAENVDYTRIVTEVTDRVGELLSDNNANTATEVDYDKIVYETAEKVVESLPPVEKIDYDKLSDMIASKIAAPAVDYDLLADKVADKVAEKLATKETETEVFIDEDGVQTIADKLSDSIKVEATINYERICEDVKPEPIDYDKLVSVLLDRISGETFTFEEVVEETPVEEIAEEVVEEVVEAPVEEVVEEVVEEAPAAQEELAAAVVVEEAPAAPVEALVEAGGDLVVRLKRSFVAKLKQSEDDIKAYYSELKNALTEYKKINSNISWHGDRFNFGRDTVARITIIGKTLGLYLALDPADPEFKQTVYRQKDVSKQKAYEGTPFMVKVKSDGGLKKALRLVLSLAEKLGTEKEEGFEAVDYVAMYPNATDEEMLAEGLIKATKEKKVDLDF